MARTPSQRIDVDLLMDLNRLPNESVFILFSKRSHPQYTQPITGVYPVLIFQATKLFFSTQVLTRRTNSSPDQHRKGGNQVEPEPNGSGDWTMDPSATGPVRPDQVSKW